MALYDDMSMAWEGYGKAWDYMERAYGYMYRTLDGIDMAWVVADFCPYSAANHEPIVIYTIFEDILYTYV